MGISIKLNDLRKSKTDAREVDYSMADEFISDKP